MDAARFAQPVRAHWRMENSLHWVLDVNLDEDRAPNWRDHEPENLTILRELGLNVLCNAGPEVPVRCKRERSGWSDEFDRTINARMR